MAVVKSPNKYNFKKNFFKKNFFKKRKNKITYIKVDKILKDEKIKNKELNKLGKFFFRKEIYNNLKINSNWKLVTHKYWYVSKVNYFNLNEVDLE